MLNLKRLKDFKKEEFGASALLSIVIIGILIVTMTTATLTAVSFSSKIAVQQQASTTDSINTISLVSKFETEVLSDGTITPEYSDSKGYSYKVYYSEAVVQPTNITATTVKPLTATIPSVANWVMLHVTTPEGKKSTLVYKNFLASARGFDNAILNTKGSVQLVSSSKLLSSVGSVAPANIVQVNGNVAITDSEVQGNVFINANVTGPYTYQMTRGTVKGNINSSTANGAAITLTSGDVFGSICGPTASTGSARVVGTKKVATNCALGSVNSLAATPTGATVVTPTAAQCTTFSTFKTLVESMSVPSYIDTTTAGCTFTALNGTTLKELKLKTEVYLKTNLTTLNNVTVNGQSNTSSLHIFNTQTAATTFSNIKHINGAKGVLIFSGSTANVNTSNINGSIVMTGVTGATNPIVKLSGTTVNYTPFRSLYSSKFIKAQLVKVGEF